MQTWINVVLLWPSVICSALSIACDWHITYHTFKLKQFLIYHFGFEAKTSHDYIIFDLIFGLAITDSMWQICFIINLLMAHFSFNEIACVIIGFCMNYLAIFTSFWKLLIPSYLFYLLTVSIETQAKHYSGFKHSPNRVSTIKNTITLIFVILSFIGTILPLNWDNKNYYVLLYNYTTNDGNQYGGECWVSSYFQLCFYGILMLSVIFDIITLVIAFYKYNQTKSYTNAFIVLIKRLFAWAFVFLVIGIVPFVDRLLELIYNNNFRIPLWLVLAHNYGLGASGIANGIVWYFNGRIQARPNEVSSSINGDNNNNNNNNIFGSKNNSKNSKNEKNNSNNNKDEKAKPLLDTNEASRWLSTMNPTMQPTIWQTYETYDTDIIYENNGNETEYSSLGFEIHKPVNVEIN